MPLGCCFNALWELNNNSKLQSVFYASEVARKKSRTKNRILPTRHTRFRFVDFNDSHVENQYGTKAYFCVHCFYVGIKASLFFFKFNSLFFCLHPFNAAHFFASVSKQWTLTTSWICFSRRVSLSYASTFKYVWLFEICTHDDSSHPHLNGNIPCPTNEFVRVALGSFHC